MLGAWWEPADEERIAELVADQDPDGPYFVAWAFFAVIIGELSPEQLESLVTPESLSTWDLEELRSMTHGYGVASRVIYAADDVAYVKLIQGPEFPSILSAPTLVEALIVTLQRRPDLGDQWRAHALGRPLEPKQLPNTTLRLLARDLGALLGDLKKSWARLFP